MHLIVMNSRAIAFLPSFRHRFIAVLAPLSSVTFQIPEGLGKIILAALFHQTLFLGMHVNTNWVSSITGTSNMTIKQGLNRDGH